MSQPIRLSAEAALTALLEHPHYRYRGCAPDPDDPRVAAGDNTVSVDAWQAPDVDGGEAREVREAREAAAIDVCVGCPVMVQCLAYGSSLTPEGKLPEPYAILGGRTALERTKALVRERQAAPVPVAVSEPVPVEQLRTEQKLAVLRGLARFVEADQIAVAARVDLRTAKWQLARLTTQLGLPKTATRMELLEAAVERGLLDAAAVVHDNGSALAIPRTSRPRSTPKSGDLLVSTPVIPRGRIRQHHRPAPAGSPSRRPSTAPSRRSNRDDVIPGQLAFFGAEALAPVSSLFTTTTSLENAA